jgi:hypothetical protein
MVEPQAVFTPEQYAGAEARIGINHPVITVIDTHLPQLIQLGREYSAIVDNHERFEFMSKTHGFLADALVDVGPYTLKPLDLVAVWSRVTEVFSVSSNQRYAIAEIVSAAYAVQGLEDPKWKRFPRCRLENFKLPEDVVKDKEGFVIHSWSA